MTKVTMRRIFLGAGLCAPAWTQATSDFAKRDPILLGNRALPGYLRGASAALGERLRVAGKEQVVQSGSIALGGTTFPMVAVRQLPNKVRIEIGGAKNRVLGFDGKDSRVTGSPEDLDEDLLESFGEDTAEGLLAEAAEGMDCRVLTARARPNAKKFPNYSGPSYMVIEAVSVAKARASKEVQVRRYYFDADTQYLLRTIYLKRKSGQTAMHETRFGDWRVVGGSALPHRVERLVANTSQFVFSSAGSQLGTTAPDAIFAPGKK